MKTTRVQYTVREDFTETNKQNIAKVMEDLRKENNPDIRYSSYQHEDGKTFMHIVTHNSEEASSLPGSLESFKEFQRQLKENIEIVPKAEKFTLAGSSFDLF